MIDRIARDRAIATIRSYMDDKITAFEFDEVLGEIAATTEDKSVRAVASELWFYYDDCRDHNIVASKAVWDHFNRLLLVLTSDGEIRVVRAWRSWHASQIIAAVALALFILLAVRKGWGPDLFALAIPFGFVSMVVAWLNIRRHRRAATIGKAALDPFSSFRSLRSIRRRTRGFTKITYPQSIAERTIRGAVAEVFLWTVRIPVWLIFSPLVLIVQALPNKETETMVSLAES